MNYQRFLKGNAIYNYIENDKIPRHIFNLGEKPILKAPRH